MGPKQSKREKSSLRARLKALFRDDQSLHQPSNAEASQSRATSPYGNANTPQPDVSTTSLMVSPATLHAATPVVPENQSKQSKKAAPDPQYASTQADIHTIMDEFERVKAGSEQDGLTYTNRHGEKVVIAERVAKLLKSLDGYASIVDVAIQHSPAITALVWAGARFILKVALNHIEYMETLESVMATIIERMAVCKYYATIYADANLGSNSDMQALQERFESALPNLFEAVLAFVNATKRYFDPSKSAKSKILDILKPFSLEIRPLLDDISEKENVVRETAEMATMGMAKTNSKNHEELHQIKIVLNEIKMEMGPMSKLDEALSAVTEIKEIVQNTSAGVDDMRQHQKLSMLPCASDAAFNSAFWEHEPRCLLGTRVDLIRQILQWCNGPTSDCGSIYWLCGMAGTGKSTISRTLSHQLHEQKRLGASFFFSKGHAELSHAKHLFTTIASQLLIVLPALRPHISNAIAENPDIFRRGLGEQWQHLICHPLSMLGRKDGFCNSQPYILLIDALDECGGERDVRLVLELISQLQSLDIILRVFITSRPERPVQLGFNKMGKEAYQRCILHEIEASVIQEDISLFLRDSLNAIRHQRLGTLAEDWPAEGDINQLCQRADNLFIYAATVCRFIDHRVFDPRDRLFQLLQEKTNFGKKPRTATAELDTMYLSVLKVSLIGKSNEEDAEQISALFKDIVGVVILLFDALPSGALARLLCLKEDTVNALLGPLGSVIYVPDNDSIRLLHPSFRDFLTDGTRCTDPRLLINEPTTHMDIFFNCLNRISTGLRRDICRLGRPGVLRDEIADSTVRKHLSPDLQYACSHWVHHLKECGSKVFEVSSNASDKILEFFQTDFLHWLEALSLIRKTSEGVLALTMLQNIMTTCSEDISNNRTELVLFMNDANRFLLKNKPEIERAPLQVYYSALLFSPTSTMGRSRYGHEVSAWIEMRTKGHVTENWDPLIQVCEAHSYRVNSVAFSRNGMLLASASDDKTVRLWDPFTGACQSTLERHSGGVRGVAFSLDGKLLASASDDKTVRLWDPFTGACQNTLEGHSDSANSVAFSLDGKPLASASDDKTVRLWDPFTGACQGTLEGHSGLVKAVAFSPDGKLLASGSHDRTVRLWDPFTGACQCTLEGHFGAVTAVAFSSDGKLLASASKDGKVRLWDPFTGTCQSTLVGHSDWVRAVAFSSDGKLLASASDDETVRLFDPFTGACQSTLKGHSDWVNSVAFLPGGRLLASGSDDKTVRLWDPFTGACKGTPEGHSGLVKAVVFSPDGKLLASGSSDRTVRLWDPFTGACQCTLEGHSGAVRAVAFSSDEKLLASASNDKTIRLWDLFTGACQTTLEGHSDWVAAVAFSPDGKLLASGSDDKTVRLWDLFTGACQGTIEGHSGWVRAVAFSPDGKLLASASYDKTIRLWDVLTTRQVQSCDTSAAAMRLNFSINGFYLETDQGNFAIGMNLDSSGCHSGGPAVSISIDADFIAWGGERLVLLPVDVRPTSQDIRDNIIAMGHRSGRVTILALVVSRIPTLK